eukprot:975609_1
MANLPQTIDLPKCVPLHRFSPKDICQCIKQWVLNDMNHKAHLAQTKQIFAKKKLSGKRMIGMELTDQIQDIVRKDLLLLMTARTLNIMFNCYDEWKNELQHLYERDETIEFKSEHDMPHPYEAIESKSAHEMADKLFHYPLNCLLERIKNESMDGSQLIQSLTTEHRSINAFDIIVEETGWDEVEVRQILSVLFRHHTWIRSEFMSNMDRVWGNTLLSADIISKIKGIVLEYDVEEIHYRIKNAKPIDEFSDCVINTVDRIMHVQSAVTMNEEKQATLFDENNLIKRLYEGFAQCFIFDRKSEDLILELQHWICNNCGNCNINMMIDSKHTKRITICVLCGLSQKQQIILKLKHQDTYMAVNDVNQADSVDDLDDIDAMITKQILGKGHAFSLRCPNQNDNLNCVAIMRLTKILIRYKRWLYTIYTKTKGKDDIERTVQVDIARFVNDDEFASIFMQSMKETGIITASELESVIKSMDNILHEISDAKAFLQLDRDTFVAIIQKHVAVPKVFAVRLHFAINKGLKQKAKSQGVDPHSIGHDVFVQIIIKHLKIVQSRSKSLQDALDNNTNDIARIATLINAGRKSFGKMIQKECKISLAFSLKLYDTILYTLKQTAQTRQFGEFLSDLDMEGITKDYHHILKVHTREGGKTCIENCFRFFKYAVHFEDKRTEIDECRSTKRNEQRIHRLHTESNQDQKDDALIINEEADIDIWRLKQHYIQSQLDIIHSYLVHSNWERFVQKYSEQAADDGNNNALNTALYDEADDDFAIQNKGKYVTDIKDCDAVDTQYGFGIDHAHHRMRSIHSSVRDELLLNKRKRLCVESFQDAIIKTIKVHPVALKQYADQLICKYYDRNYNIIRNQPIEMRHIFAIIIYTDFSDFCTMFRETFRKIGDETTQKDHISTKNVTDRHQEIYYYARCLFEAVEFFGLSMHSKLHVYHGLNRVLYFNKFTAWFNQPISTTIDPQTAIQFSRGVGIILILTAAMEYLKDRNKQVKYLPVSWLSCFPNENEYLFYGKHVVFKISDIWTNDKGVQGHSAELNVLNKFQKLLNGEQVSWNKDETDIEMLLLFIMLRLKSLDSLGQGRDTPINKEISDYSIALFNYFCDNKNKICICDFTSLANRLQIALFVDQDNTLPNVSFSKITKLFIHLTDLSLIGLDLDSMTTNAECYVNAILSHIVSASSQNAFVTLRKISIQSKKQTVNKEDSTLQKIATQYLIRYRKHEWYFDYEVTPAELKHVLIFTNHRMRSNNVLKPEQTKTANASSDSNKKNTIEQKISMSDSDTFMKDPNSNQTDQIIQQLQATSYDIWDIMDRIFNSYQSKSEIQKLNHQKQHFQNALDDYTNHAFLQTFQNIAAHKNHIIRNTAATSPIVQSKNCKTTPLPFNNNTIVSPYCEADDVYTYKWTVASDSRMQCDDPSRHNTYQTTTGDEECLLHLQYLSMGQISSVYYKTQANYQHGKEKWCFSHDKPRYTQPNEDCTIIAFCSYGQHRTTPYKYKPDASYKQRSAEYLALLKETRYISDVSHLREYEVRAGYLRYGAVAYFDVNHRVIGIQTYDSAQGRKARFCRASPNDRNERWKLVKYIWKCSVMICAHLQDWIAQCRFTEINGYLECIHRHLSATHPCRRLLEPFMHGTVSANYHLSRIMQRNGVYHRALAFKYESFCRLISDCQEQYKFKVLKKRFRDLASDSDALCPAYDDTKQFWDIMERFVRAYLDIYYGSSYDEHELQIDEELRAFYQMLSMKLRINRKYRYKRANLILLMTHFICCVTVYNKHLNEALSFEGLFASKLFYPPNQHLLQNYTTFAIRNTKESTQNDILSFAEYVLIVLNNGLKLPSLDLQSTWSSVILQDAHYNKTKQLFDETHKDLCTLQQQIQWNNKHKRYIPYNACCVGYLQSSACL